MNEAAGVMSLEELLLDRVAGQTGGSFARSVLDPKTVQMKFLTYINRKLKNILKHPKSFLAVRFIFILQYCEYAIYLTVNQIRNFNPYTLNYISR